MDEIQDGESIWFSSKPLWVGLDYRSVSQCNTFSANHSYHILSRMKILYHKYDFILERMQNTISWFSFLKDYGTNDWLKMCYTVTHSFSCWDLLRTHIFPRTRELPQFPISLKPLFLSKNRLRNPPKPVLKQNKKLCRYAQKKKFAHMQSFWKKNSFFRKFFFATGLIFERFLAPRSRFFEKVNVGYPRDAPVTVLFGEWFRFGKPSDQYPHNVALTTYFRLMVSSPKTRHKDSSQKRKKRHNRKATFSITFITEDINLFTLSLLLLLSFWWPFQGQTGQYRVFCAWIQQEKEKQPWGLLQVQQNRCTCCSKRIGMNTPCYRYKITQPNSRRWNREGMEASIEISSGGVRAVAVVRDACGT
ncbi:hypothetical protein LXL04_005527 [Taraxacum kok-saghyz]